MRLDWNAKAIADHLGMASIRPVEAAGYIHYLAQLTVQGTGPAQNQWQAAGPHC